MQDDKKTRSFPVLPIVAGLVLMLGAAAFWMLQRESGNASASRPPLTPDARAYVHNLALSDVHMKAAESYLKQAVVEIEGKIGNKGDRVLKLVEIYCVFRDPYGQVVLREPVVIAGGRSGTLAPGETKSFRLAFDNIPESWNQAMPELVIARIVFA